MYNVISIMFQQLLEISELPALKRLPALHRKNPHLNDFPLAKNNFRLAFSILVLGMNMNRLVLVRIKENYQAKIFI